MPAASYTLSTLRTEIQEEMQDTAGTYYTNALILKRINSVLARFLKATGIRRKTTTIDVNAGQAEYSLTSITPVIDEVLRVALPNDEASTDELALTYMTQEEIERQDGTWRQTTGNPWAYMRWGQGPGIIRLYPEPTGTYTAIADASAAVFSGDYGLVADLAGQTDADFDADYGSIISAEYKYGAMRVDYIAGATALSDDADNLLSTNQIPVEFQEAIKWGVCEELCQLSLPIAQVKKAPLYRARFDEIVSQARSLALKGMQAKPPRSVVGRPF